LLPERRAQRPRKYDDDTILGNFESIEYVSSKTWVKAGTEVKPVRIDPILIAGSGDSLTLGLAAQVRKPPRDRASL
jgi:hypothetical protein